ncbi:hypothetical protein [Paludibaculum fermentans]|uniref:hypothetical protein n=1 Tax=Paludibaculum fermentans TaxID=1473598 RepID=UPI003EB831B7
MKFLILSAMGLILAAPVIAGDLETAHDNLKQAVQAKDVEAVKKLATEASVLARKAIATPAPAGAEAKAAWTKNVAYAKEVDLYTENALVATALQADPPKLIDLIAALEKQNPKSKFLDQAYGPYFQALEQTENGAKVAPLAEKAILSQPENVDILVIVADSAMAKRQTGRAGIFAEKLIAVLEKKPKPENMNAEDWEARKKSALGHAHYIAGMAHSERQQFALADQDLRAALPLIKDDEQATAASLYHLGVANYSVGVAAGSKARVMEGVKFSEQSAAIKGPFAQPAAANAQRMKGEAARFN